MGEARKKGDRKGPLPSTRPLPPLQWYAILRRSHCKGGGGVGDGRRPLRSPWCSPSCSRY